MIDWHRGFGLILSDTLAGSPFTVDDEVDVSRTRQKLDVVVVRKGPGEFNGELPDGLAPLADHNLFTFKSHQETFDLWPLQELVSHFVAYRTHVSADWQNLLAPDRLTVFGVSTRSPAQLAGEVPLRRVSDGVYDVESVIAPVRMIVIHELPQTPNNASLELLSGSRSQGRYAAAHFRQKDPRLSTYLQELIELHLEREDSMDPLERYAREEREKLSRMTLEQRLEGYTVKQILSCVPIENFLAGLSDEEIEAILRKRKQSAADPAKP